MSLFMRAFKLFQSNLHALISHFEDPVKMTEQAIRDLKHDFDESMKNFAKVKAISIGVKKDIEAKTLSAQEYEQKAVLLLKKAKSGELEQAEADRLAGEALKRKRELLAEVTKMKGETKNYDAMLAKMETKISDLKKQIQKWEGEYQSLKARAAVARTSKKINQQLSSVGYDSTTALLEEMKNKIAEEENLAEAYGETIKIEGNLDEEINKALGTNQQVSGELEALKQQLIETKDDSKEDDEIKRLKKELDS